MALKNEKINKKFTFAKRTDWSLATNPLISVLDRLKTEKTPFIDLTESNPTHCGLQYPKDLILNAYLSEDNLKYDPSPQGSVKAREAISEDYRLKKYQVSPDQIFLTASTSEAYSFLFRLLVNPHECVLFPKPSYPLFQYFVDLNDIEVKYYPLRYENKRWRIDFDAIKEALDNQVKAIVLVNPNNPTGSFIHHDELDVLNKICREHGIAIIADEVFADFVFEERFLSNSLVQNTESLTFVMGGLSKSLALPQMKLSWVVVGGPKKETQEALDRLEVIADTYLSVNTPVQNALPDWLKAKNTIQSQLKTRLKANWDFLNQKAYELLDAEILMLEGGWYAILKLPKGVDEEEWSLKLLKEKHILVHPGYFFDFENEGYIIISLLTQTSLFEKAIEEIILLLKAK